jgi:hypothetical protein
MMKQNNPSRWYAFLLCTISLVSYSQKKENLNVLTDDELKDGWALLFDGTTTSGWHIYNEGAILSAWSVRDGELVCDPNTEKVVRGDLVTDEKYTNYDFTFEWKITKGGNSGVFIDVQEGPDFPTAWTTGPEYQLLDNENASTHDLRDGLRLSGCVYGLAPLKNQVTPKSFGEWNTSRILQQNGQITFWLNGVLTGQEDMTSARWKELVAASNLGKFPSFGKAISGRIALQDWANGVSLRNIKIKQLQ